MSVNKCEVAHTSEIFLDVSRWERQAAALIASGEAAKSPLAHL
jgi:hypothetical protein